MRRLVATLACRYNGKRLYGKPLQNLDIVQGKTILEWLIEKLKGQETIYKSVLAISEVRENDIFVNIANKNGLPFVRGDDYDVLSRLISACRLVDGTDVLRITSESPFPHFAKLASAWTDHVKNGNDSFHR